jgi:uncharacterized repeat protein (TIGR02543 family)
MHKKIIPILLAAASCSETTSAAPLTLNGKTYAITSGTYAGNSNWEAAVDGEFGVNATVADFDLLQVDAAGRELDLWNWFKSEGVNTTYVKWGGQQTTQGYPIFLDLHPTYPGSNWSVLDFIDPGSVGYSSSANDVGRIDLGRWDLGNVKILAELPKVEPQQGTVMAWGSWTYGQIAIPADLTDVKSIAAGALFSLALKNNGTVVGWGGNAQGQVSIPGNLDNVVSIAAGDQNGLALKNDGTVVVWGYAGAGGLNVPADLTGVTAIACGAYHLMALKNDGTVVAWGSNDSGQTTVPAGLENVVAIDAAGNWSIALKSDGSLVAWGANDVGQCNLPGELLDVNSVSIANGHGFALKNNGTVVAWGNNNAGQCNVPAGLSNVVSVSAGSSFGLALKSDGTLVEWGLNSYGSRMPNDIDGIGKIDCGEFHSLALYSGTRPRILSASTSPNGSILGGGIYDPDTAATLTATPSLGYVFSGWTGDAAGTANPLALNMDADKTVGANFAKNLTDADGDGLSAYDELVTYLTDPTKADSDNDTLSDGDELSIHKSNPMLTDTDNDGLSDRDEVVLHQSNPSEADTDNDGFDDLFEVRTGFSPLLAASTPDALSSIRTAVEFRFNAAAGVSYRIEGSTDLKTWSTVEASINGTGGVVTRFYSTETQPKRYFRVRRN